MIRAKAPFITTFLKVFGTRRGRLEAIVGPDLGGGKPDRRHEVPPGDFGEHPCIDANDLAGKRRQALDLLRVGDVHVPASELQGVVDWQIA